MEGIKWIKSESFYFNNIERREFIGQILEGKTSGESMVVMVRGTGGIVMG